MALLVGLGSVQASSQSSPGDLRHLALLWAKGEFRAPLVCEIQGAPRQAVRRIHVVLQRVGRNETPFNRIRFDDLEAPPGTRCQDDLGKPEPNVIGSLSITLPSFSHPDTGDRDFKDALRREGGFKFQVRSGWLKVGPPGAPVASLRTVDFRGGTAHFETVKRGSDAWRRLLDFGERRKLALTLEAPGGERLAFDLVQLDAPTRRGAGPR